MVFLITALLLTGYGMNMLVSGFNVVSSDDPKVRRVSLLTMFITVLAAAGVIYLAAH